MGVTLNNASDYRTNGLYRTPTNPNANHSPYACQPRADSPFVQCVIKCNRGNGAKKFIYTYK